MEAVNKDNEWKIDDELMLATNQGWLESDVKSFTGDTALVGGNIPESPTQCAMAKDHSWGRRPKYLSFTVIASSSMARREIAVNAICYYGSSPDACGS